MAGPWQGLPKLLSDGRFDLVLTMLLAGLSVLLGWRVGSTAAIGLDLAACAAAGLTVRWPRAAGVALGAVLLGYLFTPSSWAQMGEYAALIPILGTGLRGQLRVRTWMTVGYGAILASVMYRTYPGDPLFLLGTAVWAALIGALWLIGNLFIAFQRVQAQARSGALLEQRLATARQLHDTTARTLARTLIQAQEAHRSGSAGSLDGIVSGIQQASLELRWTLSALRETEPIESARTRDDPIHKAIEEAAAHLKSRGLLVSVTMEGDLSRIAPEPSQALVAAIGEAGANIERHAAPQSRCAFLLTADTDGVDMVAINEVGDSAPDTPPTGMGLQGVSERVNHVGGQLDAKREGSRWITHVTIPVRVA